MEQSLACVFYQIEGKLKVFRTTIIRVGNRFLSRMVAEIVGQTAYLLGALLRSGYSPKVIDVLFVHADDVIETLEVVASHLSGTMVEQIAAPLSVVAHALVGQLPHVPCPYAGTVYLKKMPHAAFCHPLAQDAVGSRASTDIAEADEKYSVLGFRMSVVHAGILPVVVFVADDTVLDSLVHLVQDGVRVGIRHH